MRGTFHRAKVAAALLLAACGSSSQSSDAAIVDAAAPDAALDTAAALDATPDIGADLATDLAPIDATAATGKLQVSWTLNFVQDTAAITCVQAGTPTAALKIIDAANQIRTMLFACAAAMAVSDPLPVGHYMIELDLLDEGGQSMSTEFADVQLAAGATAQVGTIALAVQSLQLVWGLQRAGQIVMCRTANAATVQLAATRGTQQITRAFPCDDGMGATSAIQPGVYTVSLRLLDGAGQVKAMVGDQQIWAKEDERAKLPPIVFDVAP
jgi:hypothetical protein